MQKTLVMIYRLKAKASVEVRDSFVKKKYQPKFKETGTAYWYISRLVRICFG